MRKSKSNVFKAMRWLALNAIFFITVGVTDVKSPTGQINFDIQMDHQAEMILNNFGLGIATSPSTNLHVNGNAIVSEKIFIGSNSGSSNLNVNGSFGVGFQVVSSSLTLSESSLVLADTSSGNLLMTLPDATTVEGRKYTIKKINRLNKISIRDGGFIDNYSDVSLSANHMGFLTVISSSGNWHLLTISGNATPVVTNNLISWWKLNESSGNTVNDSSGFGNQAEAHNLASANIGTDGQFDKSVSFDGTDDYLLTANPLPIRTNNALSVLTISLWFKTSAASTGPLYMMGSSGTPDTSSPQDGILGWRSTTGNLAASFYSGGHRYATASQNYRDGQWHHALITLDTSALKLYVDGTFADDETLVTSNSAQNYSPYFYIGRRSNNSSADMDDTANFNGQIDDIRIYNRILSNLEIEALYSQGL